jgi:hypothetical protein
MKSAIIVDIIEVIAPKLIEFLRAKEHVQKIS